MQDSYFTLDYSEKRFTACVKKTKAFLKKVSDFSNHARIVKEICQCNIWFGFKAEWSLAQEALGNRKHL